MGIHRTPKKTVRLHSGEDVNLKYWAHEARIYVAGFDEAERMVTAATYSAEVSIADDLHEKLRTSLIDSLVNLAETDLLTNPRLHYRKVAPTGSP